MVRSRALAQKRSVTLLQVLLRSAGELVATKELGRGRRRRRSRVRQCYRNEMAFIIYNGTNFLPLTSRFLRFSKAALGSGEALSAAYVVGTAPGLRRVPFTGMLFSRISERLRS